MEVVWLNDERNAIPYVYDSAVPSKISFGVFERLVQDSKKGYLPEFYVLTDKSKYIGYLLLLADKKKIFQNHLHSLLAIMGINYQWKNIKSC